MSPRDLLFLFEQNSHAVGPQQAHPPPIPLPVQFYILGNQSHIYYSSHSDGNKWKKWRRNRSVWKSSFTIRMKTNLGIDGPQCYLWQASLVCQTELHFSFYCLTDCPSVCRRRMLPLLILMIKMIKMFILRSVPTGGLWMSIAIFYQTEFLVKAFFRNVTGRK